MSGGQSNRHPKFNWKVDGFLVLGMILVAGVLWKLTADFELREVVASGLGIKLISALFAVVFIRITLFIFDTAIDHNFKTWIQSTEPTAAGIYFGARYLGTCLLFAIIIG